MCITHSVGRGGINNPADVKNIQILLNINIGRLIPLPPLSEDGSISNPNKSKTVFAIEEFQKRCVSSTAIPTGIVDTGSDTLKELRKGIPKNLTAEKLQAIMPNATTGRVTNYLNGLIAGMAAYSINTPLRQAHFFAQVGHESGDLRYNEEIASGSAYEGRTDLGNTQAGDGVRFKGRGLIQLTGRANYVAYGTAKGRDFVTEPNNLLIAQDPSLAVDVACWFWSTHGLNAVADTDNVDQVTHVINGGYNGLADRKARLVGAKCFMGL
jgi:putative chitinase